MKKNYVKVGFYYLFTVLMTWMLINADMTTFWKGVMFAWLGVINVYNLAHENKQIK